VKINVDNNKKNHLKIILPVLCGFVICGIVLGVVLSNGEKPTNDSLADAQNEIASTPLPELETANSTVEKSASTTVGESEVFSQNPDSVLHDLYLLMKEQGEENANSGISEDESTKQLEAFAAVYGSTLAEMEEYGRSIGEQQSLVQPPKTQTAVASNTPTQQPKASTPVQQPSKPVQQKAQPKIGDVYSDPEVSPEGDKNNNGVVDFLEDAQMASLGDGYMYVREKDGSAYISKDEKAKEGRTTITYEKNANGKFVVTKITFSVYDSYDSYEDIPDEYKDLFVCFTDGTGHKKDSGVYEFYDQIPADKQVKYEQSSNGYWYYNSDIYAQYEDIPSAYLDWSYAYPLKDGRWTYDTNPLSVPGEDNSIYSSYDKYEDIPSYIRYSYEQHEDGRWYKNALWDGH